MEVVASLAIPAMGWLGLDPSLEEQKRFNRETARIQKEAIEWERRRQQAIEEEQKISRQSAIGDRDLARIFSKIGEKPVYRAPASVKSFAMAMGVFVLGSIGLYFL